MCSCYEQTNCASLHSRIQRLIFHTSDPKNVQQFTEFMPDPENTNVHISFMFYHIMYLTVAAMAHLRAGL